MWVIGDIHGCLDQAERLVQLIRSHTVASAHNDQLCFVGDLVDRGPDSRGVIEFVRKEAEHGARVVAGNHDVNFARACIRWAGGGEIRERKQVLLNDRAPELATWWGHGGAETIESFSSGEEVEISASVVEFLLAMPLVYRQHTTWVSHAVADIAKLTTAWEHRITVRDILNGSAEHLAEIYTGRDVEAKPILSDGVHVSGHTTVKEPAFHRKKTVLQLDTACVYGGKLTAWNSRTREFLSVE